MGSGALRKLVGSNANLDCCEHLQNAIAFLPLEITLTLHGHLSLLKGPPHWEQIRGVGVLMVKLCRILETVTVVNSHQQSPSCKIKRVCYPGNSNGSSDSRSIQPVLMSPILLVVQCSSVVLWWYESKVSSLESNSFMAF